MVEDASWTVRWSLQGQAPLLTMATPTATIGHNYSYSTIGHTYSYSTMATLTASFQARHCLLWMATTYYGRCLL